MVVRLVELATVSSSTTLGSRPGLAKSTAGSTRSMAMKRFFRAEVLVRLRLQEGLENVVLAVVDHDEGHGQSFVRVSGSRRPPRARAAARSAAAWAMGERI